MFKKNRKNLLAAILLAFVIFVGFSPGMSVYAKTTIHLNTQSVTIQTGKSKQLSMVGISKKQSKKVTWKSSNKSVATVDKNGNVKANKSGDATITAKYKGKTYRCKVTAIKKGDKENTANNMRLRISIGNNTLYANLDGSEMAKEFVKLLPQTISMQRIGGGREFYGDIKGSLSYDKADSQTRFENGDIAYWYSGNGLCLLYNNQVENPEIQSGIIVFGKITSDLSVFYDMEDDIKATITVAE